MGSRASFDLRWSWCPHERRPAVERAGKVVWGEGMFLTPHLFQQADRYHEQVLDFRLRSQAPFGWGVTELSLDEDAVANGQVTVVRCAGVLPDGLAFQIPEPDRGPGSRSIR